MIETVLITFSKIMSIEIDELLVNREQKKFSPHSPVRIIYGCSGDLLPPVIADIAECCLFWLDAHYSGGHEVLTQ